MPPSPYTFLPLRPLELLVLTMVADTPLHGYGIRQAILAHTENQMEVEAGNLYRHIRRLSTEGLIEIVRQRPGKDDTLRRFRPTALGRRVLAAELQRLAVLVRFAEDRRLIGA